MATKAEQTRKHLLDVGRRLVLQKGYGGVGLKEVLDTSGVPKGSFYYYFDSKEAFGCALLQDYFAEYDGRLGEVLALDGTAYERLMRFAQAWLDTSSQGGMASHCLVVKLAAEIADLSPDMSRLTDQGVAVMLAKVADLIALGQAEGSVRRGQTPAALAQSAYSLWLGAAILYKVKKDPAPLHDALEATRLLLAPT